MFVRRYASQCVSLWCGIVPHSSWQGAILSKQEVKEHIDVCGRACVRGKSPGHICGVVFPESLLTISFGQGGNITEYQ